MTLHVCFCKQVVKEEKQANKVQRYNGEKENVEG
jgi:hypothetical protein